MTLIKIHGGTLKIDSVFERGTTVTVTLPKERLVWVEEDPAQSRDAGIA